MARLLVVSAGALVDRDGRVLLARRPASKEMGGLWEFPGGKVDEGESPGAALVRELKEELGIDAEAACLAPAGFSSLASGEFHLLMPLFVLRKWKGIARPLEADELAWVSPEQFSAFPMPPADLPLARQLREIL